MHLKWMLPTRLGFQSLSLIFFLPLHFVQMESGWFLFGLAREHALKLEYLFTSIQGLVTFTKHINQMKIIKKWKKNVNSSLFDQFKLYWKTVQLLQANIACFIDPFSILVTQLPLINIHASLPNQSACVGCVYLCAQNNSAGMY